jgi:hypothetical protein
VIKHSLHAHKRIACIALAIGIAGAMTFFSISISTAVFRIEAAAGYLGIASARALPGTRYTRVAQLEWPGSENYSWGIDYHRPPKFQPEVVLRLHSQYHFGRSSAEYAHFAGSLPMFHVANAFAIAWLASRRAVKTPGSISQRVQLECALTLLGLLSALIWLFVGVSMPSFWLATGSPAATHSAGNVPFVDFGALSLSMPKLGAILGYLLTMLALARLLTRRMNWRWRSPFESIAKTCTRCGFVVDNQPRCPECGLDSPLDACIPIYCKHLYRVRTLRRVCAWAAWSVVLILLIWPMLSGILRAWLS